MMEETKIKAGCVVHLTNGEYSDYGIVAHLVFRRDCDLEDLARQYAEAKRAEAETDHFFDPRLGFVPWLVAEGWAVDFDTREIHIGSYGRLEIGDVELSDDVEDWRL